MSACASRGGTITRDRGPLARPSEAKVREVKAGDTLYSIAWDSGHDYHDLAAWNGIEPPYLIKPGQQLRLQPPTTRASETKGRANTHTVASGETLYSIATAAGVNHHELAKWNGIDPPYALRPGQQLRLTAPDKAATASKTKDTKSAAATKPRQTTTDELANVGEVKWLWPTEGAIIARFAPTGANKGIDLAGTSGQPIRAAAAGKVVYQGSGLRGYGQLIIVKHSADFLSAYAHCAAISVQEGSMVKAGQVIATMGNTGTDRVKLHFEIRRRGVPVDPMEHLPKK